MTYLLKLGQLILLLVILTISLLQSLQILVTSNVSYRVLTSVTVVTMMREGMNGLTTVTRTVLERASRNVEVHGAYRCLEQVWNKLTLYYPMKKGMGHARMDHPTPITISKIWSHRFNFQVISTWFLLISFSKNSFTIYVESIESIFAIILKFNIAR